MKLIVLVDENRERFEEMINIIKGKPFILIDTQNCDEENEYRYLTDSVNTFLKSDKEIMLAKFSGRSSIIKNLGEECPEMIITFTNNKNSKYYTEYSVDMFINLLNILNKEKTKNGSTIEKSPKV